MLEHLVTCRFCKKPMFEQKAVKYGVRHYAHPDCYLDAGRKLGELQAHQVRRFPDDVLARRGLTEDKARLVRAMTLLGNG